MFELLENFAGIVPIMEVLVNKGIPIIGTALACIMAIVGLSLLEATLLKKVMTLKLIFISFSVVGICIIFSGYLFNLLF